MSTPKCNKPRSIIATLLSISLLLVGISCSSSKDKTVTIAQWGQERYLIYLPLYIAIENGNFSKRGITVRISFTGNDDQTFAAVIGGSADFGVGDPAFAAIAEEKGFPAKVVGTIVNGVAIWGVTRNGAIPVIKSAEDLAGLRIGTFPSPSTNYTLIKETIESHQPMLKGTVIIQAPIDGQLALVEAKKADIGMVLEPATSIAEEQGYKVVYSSPRFYGPYAFTGITTTEKLCKERPQLVSDFVGALEEAVTQARTNPKLAENVARKLFPSLSENVIKNAVKRMIDEETFPSHIAVDERAWQRLLQTRIAVGDLKKTQPMSMTVDNSFALNAIKK